MDIGFKNRHILI